jgi:hypothetical protein
MLAASDPFCWLHGSAFGVENWPVTHICRLGACSELRGGARERLHAVRGEFFFAGYAQCADP